MPRRFFTQISRRYKQNQTHPWYLKPFDYALAHPAYFSANRRSISSALWLGIFLGLLPIPGQTPLAILGAMALRVNVPLAALAVWISNPITFVPIFYLSYRLGATILNIPPEPFPEQISWDWLTSEMSLRWKPLFYGSFIVASSVASTVYVLVNFVWQVMTRKRYRLRRNNRPWRKHSSPPL
jgi:uncharacterized protein (DUF2062 family)